MTTWCTHFFFIFNTPSAISLCCHANLSELALEDVLAASSAINQTRLNVLRERITKKILQEQQEREFEQQGQQVRADIIIPYMTTPVTSEATQGWESDGFKIDGSYFNAVTENNSSI